MDHQVRCAAAASTSPRWGAMASTTSATTNVPTPDEIATVGPHGARVAARPGTGEHHHQDRDRGAEQQRRSGRLRGRRTRRRRRWARSAPRRGRAGRRPRRSAARRPTSAASAGRASAAAVSPDPADFHFISSSTSWAASVALRPNRRAVGDVGEHRGAQGTAVAGVGGDDRAAAATQFDQALVAQHLVATHDSVCTFRSSDSASSRAPGSRAPDVAEPSAMARRTLAAICSNSGASAFGSILMSTSSSYCSISNRTSWLTTS